MLPFLGAEGVGEEIDQRGFWRPLPNHGVNMCKVGGKGQNDYNVMTAFQCSQLREKRGEKTRD